MPGRKVGASAQTILEAEVRELVRHRGLDPIAEPQVVARLVDDAVGDYRDRAITTSLPALGDVAAITRAVFDAVAGFGPLQPLLDDDAVEEIWIKCRVPGGFVLSRADNGRMSAAPGRQVTLTLEDAHGNTHTEEVRGPGGTFRLAVGRPGFRSGTWRVWANKSAPDLYLSNREMTDHHTSFHASGRWHHAFADEATARAVTGLPERFIDKWSRPEPNDVGWVKAYSIWIPSEDVIPVPADKQTEGKVTWFPVPQPRQIFGLHVLVVQPDLGVGTLLDSRPVDAFRLCDGRIALLLVSCLEASAEQSQFLADARTRIASLASQAGLQPDGEHAYRSTVWATADETGDRMAYDLAVFPRQEPSA